MKEIKQINKLGIKTPKVVLSYAILILALVKIEKKIGIIRQLKSMYKKLKKKFLPTLYDDVFTIKGKIAFNRFEATVSFLAMIVPVVYMMLSPVVIFQIDSIQILDKFYIAIGTILVLSIYSILLVVNGTKAILRNRELLGYRCDS